MLKLTPKQRTTRIENAMHAIDCLVQDVNLDGVRVDTDEGLKTVARRLREIAAELVKKE